MRVGNKGNDVLRKRRQRKPHKVTKKRRRRCGSQHYEKWSPSNFISIYIARGNDVAAVVYPHEMRQGYQSVKGGLICHIDPFIHVL